MELFSILCETCATKLRVTKPNAVGQVLACPKCANMIRVVPPPGWEPSPEVVNSLSSEQLEKIRVSISGAGFEDIDALLKSTSLPTKQPLPRKQAGSATRPATKTQTKPLKSPTPAIRDNKPPTSEAILPTDHWTSEQSRQRRKMLSILAAAIGALIIIGGLTAAYFVNASNKTVDNSLSTEPDSTVTDAVTEKPEPVNDDPATNDTKDPLESNPESTPPPAIAKDNNSDSEKPNGTEVPPVSVVNDDPGLTDVGTSEENPKPDVDRPVLPSNPLASLPTEPEKIEKGDDITNRDIFGVPLEDDSNLGGLSDLLDQANTSISEMQNLAAEIQDQETIGIAKYYIEVPDKLDIDVDNKLGLRCGGIVVKDAALISVLRDITALSGVPIAFDVENLRSANLDFRLPVNLKMEQSEEVRTDFAMVLDAALSQHKLIRTLDVGKSVVVLTAIDPTELTSESYPLPAFVSDAVLGESMAGFLKQLIGPETWTRESNPGTMELTGNELIVNQTADIHRQLQLLFSKLAAIEAGEPLPTLWASAQPGLSKPTNLKRALPLTLEELLAKIQQNTGVVVLIDWPELITVGWNPNTIVPGDLLEDSVLKTLKEIARSMKLAIRAVDENTIELTTYQALMNRPDLEVFYYGDIIKGALKQDQVLSIVNQALGQQFRTTPNLRTEFFPQLNCIVAVAPQALQRQIELILNTLRKVGK